jgi:hypothetical protein
MNGYFRDTGQKRSNRARRNRRRQWLLKRSKKLVWRRKCILMRVPKMLDMGPLTQGSVTTDHRGRFIIRLPERLDFESCYEITAAHFSLIGQCLKKGFRLRSLDFSMLIHISPSAALVLVSLVDIWNEKVGGRLRAAHKTWNPEVKVLLCQMGYFELLGLPRPTEVPESLKITFLEFVRGSAGSSQSGAHAKQLRIDLERIVGQKIKRQFLFEGLSEAITNVGQHAYRTSRTGHRHFWWMSGSFNSVNRSLTVMFYDRGEGIPKTLPNSEFFDVIKEFFFSWKDSEKIQAAMAIGKTATGRRERGKGLQNFVEFARAQRTGKLSIYSLHGLHKMIWDVADTSEEPSSTHTHDYKHSICGTLIEWTVTI